MTKKPKKKISPPELASNPRQRILEAAILIFADKGLQNARTREIAQAAGVNLAMLHYYFSSKEELYRRAVSPLLHKTFASLKAAAVSADDPRRRLQAVVGVYYDFLKSNPAVPRLILWELVSGAPALRQIISDLLQTGESNFVEAFTLIFQDGQDRGLFRPHDPDQAILSMISLCVYPFMARDLMQVFKPGLMQSAEFLDERREHVLQLLLNGLAAAPDAGSNSVTEQISLGF